MFRSKFKAKLQFLSLEFRIPRRCCLMQPHTIDSDEKRTAIFFFVFTARRFLMSLVYRQPRRLVCSWISSSYVGFYTSAWLFCNCWWLMAIWFSTAIPKYFIRQLESGYIYQAQQLGLLIKSTVNGQSSLCSTTIHQNNHVVIRIFSLFYSLHLRREMLTKKSRRWRQTQDWNSFLKYTFEVV